MVQMIRDLVAHKGDANARLQNAIRQHPAAAADAEIVGLLHHILVANRFWFLTISGEPFVAERETAAPASLDALIELYVATQRAEEDWLAGATAADLERLLEQPMIPGGRCTVAQAFMQVCLHSQGHRAQVAKMLRRHGGVAPMTDFILWLAEGRGAVDGRGGAR
jgi:uncharacterized damage-inducible protein DinB